MPQWKGRRGVSDSLRGALSKGDAASWAKLDQELEFAMRTLRLPRCVSLERLRHDVESRLWETGLAKLKDNAALMFYCLQMAKRMAWRVAKDRRRNLRLGAMFAPATADNAAETAVTEELSLWLAERLRDEDRELVSIHLRTQEPQLAQARALGLTIGALRKRKSRLWRRVAKLLNRTSLGTTPSSAG